MIDDIGGFLDDDLVIESDVLDECEDAAGALIPEMIPGTATLDGQNACLESWERVYNVNPESGASLATRQAAVAARHAAVGSITKASFEAIAAAKGYNIDSATDPHLRIDDADYLPFRAGISAAGDAVYGTSRDTVGVFGTDVATDYDLQAIFNDLRPAWVVFEFTNE